MTYGISPKRILKDSDYDYTSLTNFTMSNEFDMVSNKAESVIAEYGSDSSTSVSSKNSSVTSTPASGSPIPFSIKVDHMAGWSNEMEYIDDSQSLIPNNVEEALVISRGHERALANMNAIGMVDNEPPPTNPHDILIALHRRQIFDNTPRLDSAVGEKQQGIFNDSGNVGVAYVRGVETRTWKGLRMVGEDVEKQVRTVRANRKRCDLRRLLKHLSLAFVLGIAVMSYYWFWAM